MHDFSQVDVFTDELTKGNPLAVVHNADDLSDDQLSAIANWTNLSETTFLLRPTDQAADYRVRIFTVESELPFAGHPTLGSAAAWLAAGGVSRDPARIVQQCGVGLVPIRTDGSRLAFAAPPPLRSGPVARNDLAALIRWLGVEPTDLLDAQWADNGPGWVGLLLRDAETVLRLRPDGPGPLPAVGVIGRYPPGSECDVEVRALFGVAGSVMEDPVTGSLNASLAQWLIGSGQLPCSYLASQGTVLGRRGRVHVHADGGDIWVGGQVAAGVTGTIAV
ncbi:MAG: PhzF family phenazine biosynthesis protein [Microlunatus sp.]